MVTAHARTDWNAWPTPTRDRERRPRLDNENQSALGCDGLSVGTIADTKPLTLAQMSDFAQPSGQPHPGADYSRKSGR
jgi:hypothetical protein